MAVTYTTADKVSALLQITFDGSSSPTSTQVETIINRIEDYVDNATSHAWREVTVTEEYVEPSSPYISGVGVRFKLNHRKIKSISSGDGDKIEIWTGSEWLDLASTGTEGRANDYWVDENRGVIYILTRSSFYPTGVRFTYRFGETTVDKSIEDAVTKLTAIDVLQIPEFDSARFTDDGANHLPTQNTIESWKKDAMRVISELKETYVL